MYVHFRVHRHMDARRSPKLVSAVFFSRPRLCLLRCFLSLHLELTNSASLSWPWESHICITSARITATAMPACCHAWILRILTPALTSTICPARGIWLKQNTFLDILLPLSFHKKKLYLQAIQWTKQGRVSAVGREWESTKDCSKCPGQTGCRGKTEGWRYWEWQPSSQARRWLQMSENGGIIPGSFPLYRRKL